MTCSQQAEAPVGQIEATSSETTRLQPASPQVEPAFHAPSAIRAFGPFRLSTAERTLTRNGVPVNLGGRSLDLLLALTTRPGEVLSKRHLMEQVWPGVTVDEGSLRVHMAALRKVLGETDASVSYIATVPARGYSFTMPVHADAAAARPVLARSLPGQSNPLPPSLSGMVGRDTLVGEILALLLARRFVTVLGPGGIGKTTVAVPVGHAAAGDFLGAIRFVDLGPVSDPRLVPSAVAATLGLMVQSSDPVTTLTAFLRDKRLLLILDSCEHVIDAAAAVSEAIHARAPAVHLLVTSREALRAEGEYVFRLPPLSSPPEGDALAAAEAMAFPAVQLFVDKAAAADHAFALTDADAPAVCGICRRLDGMALAIELAAGQVGAHGVQGTAKLLESQLSLQWQGRRTALPRHQTLRSTLDWSYDLLSPLERRMLCQLSAFSGHFTVEAVEAVMAGHDDAPVLEGLASLVGKSMVVADTWVRPALYRLLDTTRAYAGTKLDESGERINMARRHATWFASLLPSLNAQSPGLSKVENFTLYAGHLGNVRSALEWCFGPDGDEVLGIDLAVGATRMLLQLSLLTECHRWAARALASLGAMTSGTRAELELQAILGQSVMFSRGNSDEVQTALLRGLELAETLEEGALQLQLLGGLHIFHERIGDFRTAMTFARRSLAVAEALGDAGGLAAAHSFMGISLHLEGHHADAEAHIDVALACLQPVRGIHFGFDYRNRARITLARLAWVQGRCGEAICIARDTVRDAAGLEHPVTLCIALIWAVSVYMWSGDWVEAAEAIRQFDEHAERHSLAPYYPVCAGVTGELQVRRGDAAVGVAALQAALAVLHADRYELLTTAFLCAIAEGQGRLGCAVDAIATIEGAVTAVEDNGDRFLLPELLRVRGELAPLLARDGKAELWLRRSLGLAQAQGAASWELRTATSLARRIAADRRDEARQVLAVALAKMDTAVDTADVRAALALADELQEASLRPEGEPDLKV